MRVRSGGSSHVGLHKEHNEDFWGVDPSGYIFILADGMGGHAGGEVASRLACEGIVRSLLPHREELERLAEDAKPDSRQMLISALKGAIVKAERDIFDAAEADPRLKGMATTCDLLFLINGILYISHVGDSRVYLLRGETGRQLTLDHNVYEFLRAQGRSEEEIEGYPHRDKLVRALGMSGGAEIDTLQLDLRQGDRIVMCSDGLHRYLIGPTQLAQLYGTHDPQSAAEFLCEYALERGGEDNITVICVEISEPGTRKHALETDSKITALERISFFRQLSYQEMLQVMPITFEQTIEAGSIVIKEGDAGENLFILVEGRCGVSRGGVELATLEPGNAFGELALLDRQPRSATVTALERCRVLVIRSSDFEKLTHSGNLAVKILWNVVHELSERLRQTSEKMRMQGLKLQDYEKKNE
ncbi:MAG: cyclic nucleotide-binding domain-containing protein [Bradymonadales bacterium]